MANKILLILTFLAGVAALISCVYYFVMVRKTKKAAHYHGYHTVVNKPYEAHMDKGKNKSMSCRCYERP